MRRLIVTALAVLSLACGSATPATAPPRAPTLDDLAWLADGPWQTASDEQGCFTMEVWRRMDATHLTGQSLGLCSSDDSIARTLEELVIEERPGSIVYVASPAGQARTEFTLTEADATHFVVENPTHDFPTRIAYTRVDGTHVSAVVSGAERSFTVEMSRTPRE